MQAEAVDQTGIFPDSIIGDTESQGKELDWMPRQTLHG